MRNVLILYQPARLGSIVVTLVVSLVLLILVHAPRRPWFDSTRFLRRLLFLNEIFGPQFPSQLLNFLQVVARSILRLRVASLHVPVLGLLGSGMNSACVDSCRMLSAVISNSSGTGFVVGITIRAIDCRDERRARDIVPCL